MKVMIDTVDKHGEMDRWAWVKELFEIVPGMGVGAVGERLERLEDAFLG
jgi:hypothetical protein